MRLCWSAIVRNERAIIQRCVDSLLPHIACAVVVDTGSVDDTPGLLRQLFAAAGKPIEIHHARFVDFSQARNEALARARSTSLPWDYLLLADADMELKVHRPNWLNGGSNGLAYDLRQTAGSVTYFNRRLVSRQATGGYVGCTHEYLDIASAGTLDGAEFVDHADGANRADKFSRDIALLERALPTEVRPGLVGRYHFYLGQSYFDAGNWAKAAEHYRKRVELGGWDEERWNAQMRYAHCLGNLGKPAEFVWEMLRAYEMRPQRAEVLYDLAKFFRERAANFGALLFCEAGLLLPRPNDQLFVNRYVYDTGLKEEFGICAYYDERRRRRGGKVTNELSLTGSEQARNNMFWYLQPLARHVPSFQPHRLALDIRDGWVATNPSVINDDGRPRVLVRTVNYTITPDGQYEIRGSDGARSSGNPIHTRNCLVQLSRELTVSESHELALPDGWPPAQYGLVRGFEDSRLFKWNGQLWTISTVRELTPQGWCKLVLAPVTPAGYGGWAQLRANERAHEKNWMPWVRGDELRFVYRLGILTDRNGEFAAHHPCAAELSHISGGSQVIEAGGRYLALVHEARPTPGRSIRHYFHRFVSLNADGAPDRISAPFVFFDRQIEFAAGLAYFPDQRRLMASFGVMDREAWLASMDIEDVISFLYKDEPKDGP